MTTVWKDTLDEYEKCILRGDMQGAAILRALLLAALEEKKPVIPQPTP